MAIIIIKNLMIKKCFKNVKMVLLYEQTETKIEIIRLILLN